MYVALQTDNWRSFTYRMCENVHGFTDRLYISGVTSSIKTTAVMNEIILLLDFTRHITVA